MTEAGTLAADTPADFLSMPIHRTILEKLPMGGIDKELCTDGPTILIFTIVSLRNPWVLLAFPSTYLTLWLATKRDPDQFNCYLRYSKQGDFYELRLMLRQTRNACPKGSTRGELY